jgi:xanthine dehydrogenase accessory factor
MPPTCDHPNERKVENASGWSLRLFIFLPQVVNSIITWSRPKLKNHWFISPPAHPSRKVRQAIFDTTNILADHHFFNACIICGPENIVGRKIVISTDRQNNNPAIPGLTGTILNQTRGHTVDSNCRKITLITPEEEQAEVFIQEIAPLPTLVIVGGAQIAVSLTSFAGTLGFRTIIIDPKNSFGKLNHLPNVDQLIHDWPEDAFAQIDLDENTAVVMLSHDPEIDDPALAIALRSPAFYIGALGSAQTQVKRRERLLNNGFLPAEIAKIHGPVGLNLGSNSSAEIALEIISEIVAVQHEIDEITPLSA